MSGLFEWFSAGVARSRPTMAPVDGARLHRIGQDCWSADRELVYARGRLPTRMVILRGARGGLTLYSPVDLDLGTAEAIAGLGPVTNIIAPNRFHTLFVAGAMETYPDARLLVAAADGGLAARFPDRTEVIGERVFPESGLELVPVRLRDGLTELVLYHDPSETLILADLLFNIQQAASPVERFAYRLNGIWRQAGQSRLQRLLFLREQESLAGFYRWALSKPFVQLVMAHGQIITADARERFYQVFKQYGR